MNFTDTNNKYSQENINLELTGLWYSNSNEKWTLALDRYYSHVRPQNVLLDDEMNNINTRLISELSPENFYNFLHDKYFVWKYTAKNRLATTRKSLQRYVGENRLSDLDIIKQQIFSFDLMNTKKGLEIGTSIHGLGTAGASGLLALLFPSNFGTVDQFVVKALMSIKDIEEKEQIKLMNPNCLKIADGVELIKIMRDKASTINLTNNTNNWTPRQIDKVLWTYGR
jgi:hypothetical protein